MELDMVRRVGQWGLEAIDYSQIRSWSILRGVLLRDWELATLLRMDRAFLNHKALSGRERRDETTGEVVSERPLTAELFDALFPST